LDENVNTENLERCVAYFKNVYKPLIPDFNPHYEYLLLDNALVLSVACNTIQTDANIIKCVVQVIFMFNKIQPIHFTYNVI